MGLMADNQSLSWDPRGRQKNDLPLHRWVVNHPDPGFSVVLTSRKFGRLSNTIKLSSTTPTIQALSDAAPQLVQVE